MMNRASIFQAVLAAMAALLMVGCQSRTAENGEAKPGAETAASAKNESAAAAKEAHAPAEALKRTKIEFEDPFADEIAANLASVPDPAIEETAGAGAALDNDTFRDRVVAFVRQVSAGGDKVTCELAIPSQRPFRAVVSIYARGAKVGRGDATDAKLCVALKEATRRSVAAAGGKSAALANARFVIDLPEHQYSLVEFQGQGIELASGVVPVRTFDKEMLRKRIDEGKAYLLRVIDRERKGVHKYYHAPVDQFENRLHTIYTASTIFTLLKLYAYDKDKRLLDEIKGAAGFLLAMQSRDKSERSYGGFYYSFDLTNDEPEPRLVVGTTSKTIFTLIELHNLTKDKKYLDAAHLGANWLMSMQRPEGSVRSYMRKNEGGGWVFSKKESMLYTGQVLSALSRMYGATRQQNYLDSATRTANYLAGKVADKGCYLGDDYRKDNPISSSWLILSLFDYVKVTDDPRFKELVFRCTDDLLRRQIVDTKDLSRYGRWYSSMSSSGSGWLAEVLSELYLYCEDTRMGGCDRYKDSIVKVLRMLMQHTYSPENAFVTKNPEMAIGGVFWNSAERYVRTDSVCHAMNAYINMIGHLGDGPLLEVPEPPLAERLAGSAQAPGTAGQAEPMGEERDDEAGEDEDSDVNKSAEEAAGAAPAP